MITNYRGHTIEAQKHSEKVSYSVTTKSGEVLKNSIKKGGLAQIVYDLKTFIDERIKELEKALPYSHQAA
ncbi:MAG: hypothetical protein ACTHMM_21295 [Agriterribacter sp.]